MEVHVERLAREPVIEHDFAANKGFQWESGEHVESETEAGDVHHDVVRREVVEYVALGKRAEGKEAGESHEQACYHGNTRAVVGNTGESIYRRSLE